MTVRSIALVALAAGCVTTAILTQHNDPGRSGANSNEVTLTVAAVKSGHFGKLFSRDVSGQIYAQPLYVAGVSAKGALHNVVYVATQQNVLYAFDADHPAKSSAYWTVDFGSPEDFVTLWTSVDPHCVRALPWVGITSTPVIVRANSTGPDRMFVVSKHQKANAASIHDVFFKIHIVRLDDGVILNEKNIDIPNFDPAMQLQRTGLVWVPNAANGKGAVYFGFGGHCDGAGYHEGTYHGWVVGYDDQLNQVGVFNTTPKGSAGGVWQAGQGVVSDGAGSLYVATGNGTVTSVNGGSDFGSSFLKLTIGPTGSLSLGDWFTPYNWQALNQCDVDPASAGPLLLPYKNRLVGGGKEGVLYVLDRGNLGKCSNKPDTGQVQCTNNNGGGGLDVPPYTWNPQGDLPNVVQAIPATKFHIHGSPVIWDRPDGLRLYVWSEEDALREFKLDNSTGLFGQNAVATGSITAAKETMPGGILSLSSNGPNDGIVWATVPTADAWTPNWPENPLLPHKDLNDPTATAVPGRLYAFEGVNLGKPIWESDTNPADDLGFIAKFVPPTIADGEVFVASFPKDMAGVTTGHLQVYGIQCPSTCANGTQCVHGSCQQCATMDCACGVTPANKSKCAPAQVCNPPKKIIHGDCCIPCGCSDGLCAGQAGCEHVCNGQPGAH
jgi:hypothetical protein